MIPIIFLTIENESDRDFMIWLYTEYSALMYATAAKIIKNNSAAIEDIVHDTLVNLIRNIDKIREIDCCEIPAYIVVCIRRVCFNYLKHKKVVDKYIVHSIDSDDCSVEYADGKIDIEEEVLSSITIEELRDAFLKMPQKLQDVLEYKYLLDMTDEEIAECIGVKKNSVREYLTRARRAALELVKENGHE